MDEEHEKLYNECTRHTDLIKVLSVCAIMMEITRNLKSSDKKKLKEYCSDIPKKKYFKSPNGTIEEKNYDGW